MGQLLEANWFIMEVFNLTSNHLSAIRLFMQSTSARAYSYTFPAIRGVQAGREYYATMCPLKHVPKLFRFDEPDIPPELRAQRSLNKARIPKIAEYMIRNTKDYCFSALTASIDSEVNFMPMGKDDISRHVGILTVPMDARFLINDGQHRRAAIEEALKESPRLQDETISVIFFIDGGLSRSQQMFADLNRYAVRTTRSLGILYDHREPFARLTDRLVKTVSIFKGMTEMAKSTISNRSRKLFTLSSIYSASRRLLRNRAGEKVTEAEEKIARDFWTEISKNMPDWQDAVDRKVTPSELRRDYIHAHGIALQSLAIAGGDLIVEEPSQWKNRLSKLRNIDWSRTNTELWEGRAMIGGRIGKAQNQVILTANVIKRALGIRLTPEEKKVEDAKRAASAA